MTGDREGKDAGGGDGDPCCGLAWRIRANVVRNSAEAREGDGGIIA